MPSVLCTVIFATRPPRADIDPDDLSFSTTYPSAGSSTMICPPSVCTMFFGPYFPDLALLAGWGRRMTNR